MEGLSKAALMKSLSPRVMLSNHLLPKGTKMKVNLEDQGRQKVSFSFSQTKKPTPSVFFVSPSPEKSLAESSSALTLESSPPQDRTLQNLESVMELQSTTVPTSTAEPPSPPLSVSSPPKPKMDLGKIHFKKQILSISVTEEKPMPSNVPQEPISPEQPVIMQSSLQSRAEVSSPQLKTISIDCLSENVQTEASVIRVPPSPHKPIDSFGKDGDTSIIIQKDDGVPKRKTRSQSERAPAGSESDGDGAKLSSSHKIIEPSIKTKCDGRSKEEKKSSSGSNVDEKESSSKRSENHESSSSYSKSERDSRHASSRSSRSEKERRRSRTKSRSRSRGSRTSSSHSRTDRSRCDRVSRSDRSYYHDSDRRSHRSPPRRERRSSRSRTDRSRDSSDSDDDHRRNRNRTNDSSRSSVHASLQKDTKSSSSHSKSEKDSKSVEFSQSAETDKKSNSLRTGRRTSDSESHRKRSPEVDSNHRKSATHHKSQSSAKSTYFSQSQTSERRRQKSPSSDLDADQKGKTRISDRSSGTESSCLSSQKIGQQESKDPSKSSSKMSVIDRKSQDAFHSLNRIQTLPSTTESHCVKEKELSDACQAKEQNNKSSKDIVLSFHKDFPEPSSQQLQAVRSLEMESTSNDGRSSANQGAMDIGKESHGTNNVLRVDSKAITSNSCINNNSSVGTALVAEDLQQSAISEDVQPTNYVAINLQPGTGLPKISHLKAENQLLPTSERQHQDPLKKTRSSAKKSRWDIVGQDASDSDNSQRLPTADNKASVKKVISDKKIDISKDVNPEEGVKQQEGTHSITPQNTERTKHDTISHSTSSSKCSLKDQNKTDIRLSDSKESVTEKLCENHTSEIKNTTNVQHLPRIVEESHNAQKSTPVKRESVHVGDSGGLSNASESDDSESDSDCGQAIKRLSSIVVIPQQSSIALDPLDTGASCSPMSSSEEQHRNEVNHHKRGAGEVPTEFVFQQRHPSVAPACEEVIASAHEIMCQSQSNMIDSTSQSEGSNTVNAQPYKDAFKHVEERLTTSALNEPATHSHESFHLPEHGYPYVSGRDGQMLPQYHQEDLLRNDTVNSNGVFRVGWDFSQSEQPSSTYQQPDSSYGPQLLNPQQTGIPPLGLGYRQGNASWTPLPPIMQSSRPPYLHMPQHYQDPLGQVHPDSLTNDHEDDGDRKAPSQSQTCNGPNTSTFVQANEISSNSRGSTVSDHPRDSEALRPHRGRGPPKKRRQEIESDSDNEAEPGPMSKRERHRDGEVTKDAPAKAELSRPLLDLKDFRDSNKWKDYSKSKKMPPYFDLIDDNLYLTERYGGYFCCLNVFFQMSIDFSSLQHKLFCSFFSFI